MQMQTLEAPPKERDAQVARLAIPSLSDIAEILGDNTPIYPLPNLRVISGMIDQAHAKAMAESRREDINECLNVIRTASKLERIALFTAVLNAEIEEEGCDPEMEDALCVLKARAESCQA